MKKLLKRVADTCLSPLGLSQASERLWQDPAFKAAVAGVVDDLKTEFIESNSPEQREKLHAELRALNYVTHRVARAYMPKEESETN